MNSKMPVSEKEQTIATVFYHPRTGFGSVERTFRAARAVDNTIRRGDVREFLAKQEVRQRKKPSKVNSFVADFPRQEFQVDLADFGERAVPRYGFAAIDIFSKKGACFPITSKEASKTTEALRKTFDELGYPSTIMCDEGGEFYGEFAEECKNQDIDLLYSRTGGRFVERFIRTLKMALFERRHSLGGRWNDYVQEWCDHYNDSVHSSTRQRPDFIADYEYDFPLLSQARAAQMKIAKFPVTHPDIVVGDHVKIRIKPSGFYKETFNSWSPEVYVVERIDEEHPMGALYHLRGYQRPLLRFEIKKVADVQRVVGGEVQSVINEVVQNAPAKAAQAMPQAAQPAQPVARRAVPAVPVVPYERPVTRSMSARASLTPAAAAAALRRPR